MNDKVQTRNSPMDLELYKKYEQYLSGELFIPDTHYRTWREHLCTFCIKIVDAVRKHRDFRGDDRCWEDDEWLYKTLPEGYTPPERDTAVEIDNCKKFIGCRRNPATTYVSPQRRIEELEQKINKYDKNISWLLDNTEDKYIVRVREGGALEELIDSLVVSFIKMRSMLMFLEEENKELQEKTIVD